MGDAAEAILNGDDWTLLDIVRAAVKRERGVEVKR